MPADPLLERSWARSWTALDARPSPGLFERLLGCYGEPHRHYHTLQHLQECIEGLEPALALAEHPGEVEVALWFHDAIYEPRRHDNELKSAAWAQQELTASGASTEGAGRVHALVMATRHSGLPANQDERLLVDVDLSILGADDERFAEYERQVREEYSWVPAWMFRFKRKAILREFLARDSLYGTPYFRERLEARARRNLERVLD